MGEGGTSNVLHYDEDEGPHVAHVEAAHQHRELCEDKLSLICGGMPACKVVQLLRLIIHMNKRNARNFK